MLLVAVVVERLMRMPIAPSTRRGTPT